MCVEVWPRSWMKNTFTIIILTIQYLLPLLILPLVHAQILRFLGNNSGLALDQRRREKERKRNKRMTFVLSCIAVTFAVRKDTLDFCWQNFNLQQRKIRENTHFYILLFGSFNIEWINQSFRTTCFKVLHISWYSPHSAINRKYLKTTKILSFYWRSHLYPFTVSSLSLTWELCPCLTWRCVSNTLKASALNSWEYIKRLFQNYFFTLGVCHVLAMSSCVSNPVLYGWLNTNLRKEFLKVWIELHSIKTSLEDLGAAICKQVNFLDHKV